MQKSDTNPSATMTHRKVQSSTTLNRRYVSRPASMTRPMDGMKMRRPAGMDIARKPVDMTKVTTNMKARTMAPVAAKQPTAQELKERAIAKALSNAAKPEKAEVTKKKAKNNKLHLGLGRVLLAFSCAAAAVAAIVYFVNLNMPDISMRVAAMQSGIDPKYPAYVPRDFSVKDMVAEEGKITLNFANTNTGDSFSLTEERSSWDSNALLSNYIKNEFGEDYSTIREQGLTVYITNNAASWVNGGMLYKLNISNGTLTKKQIRSIATSL